jgi:GntR family transcriptional regulator, hexuronate regulon transcriptional repressor
VVDEHTAILDALRAHDPAASRAAMRGHLTQVIDSLLFATEERQIAEARQAAQAKRNRYAQATA